MAFWLSQATGGSSTEKVSTVEREKNPAKTGCLQVISTDLPSFMPPPRLNNLLGKKVRVNATLPRVTVLNRYKMAPH